MYDGTEHDPEKPSSIELEYVANSSVEAVDEKRAQESPFPSYSPEMENQVLRKMDLRIIPMLAILYLLAFLDRGNIGNAKIEGLLDDLHMTGPQYSWCLTVFFFTYCAFELPSNLVLKKLKPSRWLPFLMVAWGIVMTLMGIVQNYAGLLTARIFLGVAGEDIAMSYLWDPRAAKTNNVYFLEAGLYPGAAYYITLWYPRHRAQYRQAMFFSAASIAGAFSGVLAYAIAKMDGVGGYAGWRWIFILEGLLTVVVACFAPFAIHDFPETAKFLTDEERKYVIHMLRTQSTGGAAAESSEFRMQYVIDALLDWQIYVSLFVYWGITCPLYGISFFLPSIIKDLGYTSSTAQLLTVPIYITAAVVAVVAAWLSDRRKQRSPFILFFMGLIAIGFIIVLASTGRGVPGVVYFGVFVSVVGIYPAFPGNITWLSANLAGDYKRASGMAIQIGLGNLAGAMASNFYRAQDAPNYILGHALELGFCVVGMIAVVILRLSYQMVNKKRDRMDVSAYDEVEMEKMGDRSPMFRYML
ncbi:putative MFS nicotinic acid transporter Tna1 [Aspergillus alliaceus]|uniref:putative MFS nicotinic acid transporter Tna1 n=1 Tax=Petromyces alliaceus TaxID=209559 RepID=UPI0012A4B0E6|nr:putative MFS nicotinic acid transporter Tna1 [Aspergillus alliaceus]KAB8227124.1 putative MFS nicotinic acid transporter Tna1 [Aspergillus alliaceus]